MRRAPSQSVCVLLFAVGVAALPPVPTSASTEKDFPSREEYLRYLKEHGLRRRGDGEPPTPRPSPTPRRSPPCETAHDSAFHYTRSGRWREAVQEYDKAITAALADPVNGPDLLRHAYYERGDALWILKDYTRALADYRMAVKQADLLAKKRGGHDLYFGRKAYVRLAVALAAYPDPSVRDRAKIVALAEAAVAMEVDGRLGVECEAVLAGLHAVLGDFPAAVRVQRRLVERLEHSPLRRSMTIYLEHYRDRETVWGFDPFLTGPADPRPRKPKSAPASSSKSPPTPSIVGEPGA